MDLLNRFQSTHWPVHCDTSVLCWKTLTIRFPCTVLVTYALRWLLRPSFRVTLLVIPWTLEVFIFPRAILCLINLSKNYWNVFESSRNSIFQTEIRWLMLDTMQQSSETNILPDWPSESEDVVISRSIWKILCWIWLIMVFSLVLILQNPVLMNFAKSRFENVLVSDFIEATHQIL